MRGLILAVSPDNTPSGYYWTFLFPMLLFIVIGTILYLLFSRPHRRVPARMIAYRGASPGPSGPYTAAAAGATAVGATATTSGGTTESAASPADEPGPADTTDAAADSGESQEETE